MKTLITKLALYLLLFCGVVLTLINIYGTTQDIRPDIKQGANLRFPDDVTISRDQIFTKLKKLDNEDDQAFADRLSHNISKSLAHIQWDSIQDNTQFNQLIPVWENYFLYFMGIFSGIPEYEKYHFADYRRSLDRGIGICGDASMVMSQLLNKQQIPNQIISFPGHVVVAVQHEQGEIIYDPDFGLTLPFSVEQLQQNPDIIESYYLDAGYNIGDVQYLLNSYHKEYRRWNGVQHFITNKYYFEKIAYFLKWPFPIALIVISVWLLKRTRQRDTH